MRRPVKVGLAIVALFIAAAIGHNTVLYGMPWQPDYPQAGIMWYPTGPETENEHGHNPQEKIAYHLAAYFATDNPRFDYKRFIAACHVSTTD